MDYRENRIATLQEGCVAVRVDGFMAGKKTAADHEYDAIAVRFGRFDHVERQRRSKLAHVNDVLRPLVIGGRGNRGGEGEPKQKWQQFFHEQVWCWMRLGRAVDHDKRVVKREE